MTDLVVIGASASGGAIVELIQELNVAGHSWILRGFLDDDTARHGQAISGAPVLGSIADAAKFPGDTQFVSGIANYRAPDDRLRVVERLAMDPCRFATLLHPRASISPHADIGRGVIIMEFAVVSDSATVGDHAMLCPFAYVAHHARVGEGAIAAPRSSLLGGASIGKSSYAGAHAVVKDGVKMGEGSIAGMGAVVIGDVHPFTTVAGNPARVISKRARA